MVVFPPKSSILLGFSIINHPFWGTPIFGNTHVRWISDTGSNETIWKDGICVFFRVWYGIFGSKLFCILTPQNQSLLNFQAPDLETYTLPETNIAPENRPSQKETSIPTIHFQLELLVSESTSNPTNNIQPTSTNQPTNQHQPTELSIRFGNPSMSFTAGPSSSVLVCTSIHSTWRSASLAMSDWLVAWRPVFHGLGPWFVWFFDSGKKVVLLMVQKSQTTTWDV